MKHLACITALTLLTVAGSASAQGTQPLAELEWRSTSETDAELAIELSALYATLYNSGNLSVREVTLSQTPYVEPLLRNEGVFMGSHFPQVMDALMCDINEDACSRTRRPVAKETLSNLAAHVGGFAATQGRWTTQIGDRVKIPDYRFDNVTVLARIVVSGDWTPKDFQAPEGLDCRQWGDSCEAVVTRYNPPTIRTTGGSIRVTVPQKRLSTTIALKADDSSDIGRALSNLGKTQSSTAAPDFVNMGVLSTDWQNFNANFSPNDGAVRTLGKNLRPVGSVSKYGVGDEAYYAHQVDLFKLINHPYGTEEDMPAEYQRSVGVVVIDSKLSAGHCDWPEVASTDGTVLDVPEVLEASSGGEPATPPPTDCATIDDLALSDGDHAAASGGLIVSQRNGKGIVGLNPSARLSFMEFDKNAVADTQIERLVDQVQRDMPDDTRVANMSFGIIPLFGNFDEVEAALAAQAGRMLFVAAAGNEGRALDPESCRILPACLNQLDNVITVVGLNADLQDPMPWRTATQGTNTNPDFELGAIAENVLSTVSGNRFARRKGTSIAAPQVSAAASLIFAAGEFIYGDGLPGAQLSPKVVKDRLIYTADFFAGLSGDVRAGRLNVGRAIDLRDAQFVLFDGRKIAGQVIEAPVEFTCLTTDNSQKFQKWWNVRRLVFNEARERHIVFRQTGGSLGDRSSALERYPSCLVNTLSSPVKVRSRHGTDFVVSEFTFADIKDYTSPLFDE